MKPDDPAAPANVPPPPPPLLDASEEEDLLRHLRRYQPRDTSRRPTRALVAVGTVAAGAGLLLGVVALARRTPPPATPQAVAARDASPAEPAVPEPRRDEGPPVETPQPAPETAAMPPAPAPTAPPSAPPRTGVPAVDYPPRTRLGAVSAGETKERVFDLFATTFEEREGSIVRIEGMRLRARGRSPRHDRVEVADVRLDGSGAATLHWFLFADGRLVAWGEFADWPAAARRHEVEIDYRPPAR